MYYENKAYICGIYILIINIYRHVYICSIMCIEYTRVCGSLLTEHSTPVHILSDLHRHHFNCVFYSIIIIVYAFPSYYSILSHIHLCVALLYDAYTIHDSYVGAIKSTIRMNIYSHDARYWKKNSPSEINCCVVLRSSNAIPFTFFWLWSYHFSHVAADSFALVHGKKHQRRWCCNSKWWDINILHDLLLVEQFIN